MMPFASNFYKYLTDYNQKEQDDVLESSKNEKYAKIRTDEKVTTYHQPNSLLTLRPPSSAASLSPTPSSAKLSDIEAIRIKALCSLTNEEKSMSVDPNITSYATLFLLLKRAFHLEEDFDVSYLLPKSAASSQRPDLYLTLTSDWDLDAAFHTASYPVLELKIEAVKKSDLDSWDLLEPINTPSVHDIKSNQSHVPLSVSLKYDLTKKIGKMLDAFIPGDRVTMVNQSEWQKFFDASGRIHYIDNIKLLVFHGGLEPSLRQEAWPHLLGVYPTDLTYEERTRFLFMKTQVYKHLKENWMSKNPFEIQPITHMVQKDVLRTDRTHPFFNVKEDHPNLVSLFNILTTFALNNPDISYCQGMSDLASPLLVITQDETLAYLCFCKVMERLKNNFLLKGTALMKKFSQLSLLLVKVDEALFTCLEELEASNFYFCYRMLLLEMKREFPFTDAIRVMETVWSSLPQNIDDEEAEIAFFKHLLERQKSLSNGKNNDSTTSCLFEGLPSPRYLNDGSPFPLFLCLAILLLNREQIQTSEDYTMLAMHFDKLSRKLDASTVLEKGRALFAEYIETYLNLKTEDAFAHLSLENFHGTGSTAAQC